MPLKVSAICTSESTLADLSMPGAEPPGVIFKTSTGSAHTLSSVLRRHQPDVLVLDFPIVDEAALQAIESALKMSPATHLVLVCPDQSVGLLTSAMRAGVREVLPSPMCAETVKLAIVHAKGHFDANQAQTNHAGQVIALIPAKGGAGATFLAANLAYALSMRGKRVAVLDLNLYFGDLILFLGNHKVVSNLFNLARQTQRLDAALLDSSMIKVSENLHILAASDAPEHISEISISGLEKVIELARGQYDFVVLDLSSTLDSVTVKALDFADNIYLSMQLNLPALYAAKRIVTSFRQFGYPRDKLSIVVNRYEKGGHISLDDVEKTTQAKVSKAIPNSYFSVTESINQGIPILKLNPRDPVARSLTDWAQELTSSEEPVHKNWFRHLISH